MVNVTQGGLQAGVSSDGQTGVTQSGVLAAIRPKATLAIRNTQSSAITALSGKAIPAVSSASVLVAYKTGGGEKLTLRSWTFALDGHTFYVVTLGEQGTFLYDRSTGKWTRWQTEGYSGWNMEIGTTWKGDIIAADKLNPVIWRLDPTSYIDNDFKTQTRVVTGALSMRQRAFIANYAFRVTASLGDVDVASTIPATEPTVTLSFSDDQGKTFSDAGTLTLNVGAFVQEVQWLSLGTMRPPMRIFKVTDTGAIARIDGADAEVSEEGQ